MYEKLPQELKGNALFCKWRFRNGRKIPIQINGQNARVSVPSTFNTFDKVVSSLTEKDQGIAVLVTGFSMIDIDDCYGNGAFSPLAKEIIDHIGSYAEFSPSGTGVHIIVNTPGINFNKERFYINNRSIGLEVYIPEETNRFMTVTGDAINDNPIESRTNEVMQILEKYMIRPSADTEKQNTECPGSYLSDQSVIEKALSSKQADKFNALWKGSWQETYGSQSEADLALASILSFWCGGDIDQMDRLFRKSDLYRDKWDRAQSGTTYGMITLEKAVSNAAAFFSPVMHSASEDFNEVLMKLQDAKPDTNPYYRNGEIGEGRLYADIHRSIARYVPERKMWFIYDGTRWTADIGNLKAMELCKALADSMLDYVKTIKDESSRTFFLDRCKRWQKRRNRETYIKEAQSIYPISASEFDTDTFLFNCSNGTLDLRAMNFREHDPEDHITKISPAIYDPKACSSRFDRFITEIMSGDTEKAEFLQKVLGYSISGDTRFECMFFLYGETTRNGKGTLMESILHAMGDYGRAVRPETIAMKNNINSQNPSEDIARLAGIRFVNISEPKRGMVLNSAQIKSMTGNDTLNARFLHENSFDFRPQFKLYVNTNYLPVINDMTLFTSGRIKIVPFNRHFSENEQDKTLKAEFTKPENQSAILNWLIEGYKKIQTDGFNIPKSVLEATADYEHSSDKISLFADERLIEDALSDIKTAEVYTVYHSWCIENGCYPESRKNFNQALRNFGNVTRKRPSAGGDKTTVLTGYRLACDDPFTDVAGCGK